MNTTKQERKISCCRSNKAISSILVPSMIGLLTIAVAIVQLYIASQQRQQDLYIASQQRQQDLFLANQTRANDIEVAEKNHQQALFMASEHQKDVILNGYLDFLADLLDNSKYASSNRSEISVIIEFKTFAALDQLDARGKTRMIQALYNSRVIRGDENFKLFVSLRHANLTQIELGTNDREHFQRHIEGARFDGSVLTKASFRHLCISDVTFIAAQLEHADFTETHSTIKQCRSSKTVMFYRARLINARFIKATYASAYFVYAILDDALLQQFQCKRCEFFGATARRADFSSSRIKGSAVS
jgi:uncharacterized protein YjbI with pentapeptide repeats